jgi:hypothetical protein
MVSLGLSEAVGALSCATALVLCLPLPRRALEALLAMRPGWVLLVASAATSLVPFVESAKMLLEYDRHGAVAYEADLRWLQARVTLLRATLSAAALLVLAVAQRLCAVAVAADLALERSKKNLEATQKQARSAGEQSLRMLDELDALKKSAGGKPAGAAAPGPVPATAQGAAAAAATQGVEKLLSELVAFKAAAEEAQRETEVVKAQARAFQREHDRLLKQVAQLEAKLDRSAGSREPKKDK